MSYDKQRMFSQELIYERLRSTYKDNMFIPEKSIFDFHKVKNEFKAYDYKKYDNTTSATASSTSDSIIPTEEFIRTLVDTIKLRNEVEEEVRQAAPEGQEFIFDPKELDI